MLAKVDEYKVGQKVRILKPNNHYTYTGIATIVTPGWFSSELSDAVAYRFSTDKPMYNRDGVRGKDGTGLTYNIYIEPLLDVTEEFTKKAT